MVLATLFDAVLPYRAIAEPLRYFFLLDERPPERERLAPPPRLLEDFRDEEAFLLPPRDFEAVREDERPPLEDFRDDEPPLDLRAAVFLRPAVDDRFAVARPPLDFDFDPAREDALRDLLADDLRADPPDDFRDEALRAEVPDDLRAEPEAEDFFFEEPPLADLRDDPLPEDLRDDEPPPADLREVELPDDFRDEPPPLDLRDDPPDERRAEERFPDELEPPEELPPLLDPPPEELDSLEPPPSPDDSPSPRPVRSRIFSPKFSKRLAISSPFTPAFCRAVCKPPLIPGAPRRVDFAINALLRASVTWNGSVRE